MTFNEQDLAQIQEHGLTPETVELQVENFKRGFPFLKVVKAAQKNHPPTSHFPSTPQGQPFHPSSPESSPHPSALSANASTSAHPSAVP